MFPLKSFFAHKKISTKFVVLLTLVLLGFSFGTVFTTFFAWTIATAKHCSMAEVMNQIWVLKSIQLLQTCTIMLVPACLSAYLFGEKNKPFFPLNNIPLATYLLAAGCLVCAFPLIETLTEWNETLRLPESMKFIERRMISREQSAALLTQRFLDVDNVMELFGNILLMALVPAIVEELMFRGVLQKLFSDRFGIHLGIWLSALIFSTVHLQFYGFLPRFLMGAMLGYFVYWSGSLLSAIFVHFLNNAATVLFSYIYGQATLSEWESIDIKWSIAGAIFLSLGLVVFYKKFNVSSAHSL